MTKFIVISETISTEKKKIENSEEMAFILLLKHQNWLKTTVSAPEIMCMSKHAFGKNIFVNRSLPKQ